jgi:hypothetical protein
MGAWLLILQVMFPANAHTETQIGPFVSQATCEAAAQQAKKGLSGTVRAVCVSTGQATNSN